MTPEGMLRTAKEGGPAERGALLDQYRNYLRLLARVHVGPKLQGKVDASDVVQDTLLDAHEHFGRFSGTSERQLVHWLRTILAARVANLLRHYFGTKGRDIRLERRLELDLNRASSVLEADFADSVSTPSQGASRREQQVILADALEQLPADYRDVIVLRHLEDLPFSAVAARMNRSLDSVEKLWVRGLAQLRRILGPTSKIRGEPDVLSPEEHPDDGRLSKVAQEYLADLESGKSPDRRTFLDRYPDLGDDLEACLETIDQLHRVKLPRPLAAPSEGPVPGEPLGDFQILREIGRGGMGIVYEATQLSLGRRVALKVLPFAATFDSKHLQRFQNEAKAAAQLHHTNIVPVYAVGCERGVHFYAMQMIEGQSLAQVIRYIRSAAGRPVDPHRAPSSAVTELIVPLRGDPLSDPASGVAGTLSSEHHSRPSAFFRSAARSAQQAAEALDYAHQAGIVHRDIKPANLLVDARGRLWVTDFGLAQFHTDADLTRTGDLLGTLRYMSPEQAAGRHAVVDQRSDVYSLGATLYELVTLEPMFPGRNRDQVLEAVLRQDPRPPRAVERSIPEDLETIILKAVNKDPQDRYASGADFAEDLRRFLEDKPILARRPSPVDRARKWLRRHPSVVVTGLVFLLLCMAGLLVSNRLIAAEQAKTVERAREAEDRFHLARRSVDEMIRIADEELSQSPSQENVRRRLLETALAYYREFMEQRLDDPRAQVELAATSGRVRKILADLATLEAGRYCDLLEVPSVLDDLGLTGDQRAGIAQVTRTIEEDKAATFREGIHLEPEDRKARLLRQARAAEAVLEAALSPDKLTRLRQIALQLEGPRAFQRPDVEAALELSPRQKLAIHSIEADVVFRGVSGALPEPENPADRERAMAGAMDRIVALFSDAQAKRWRDLIGPSFTGARPFRSFRRGAAPGTPDPGKGAPQR